MKCFGCRNWPGHASLTRAHVTQEGAVPRIVPRVVVELERPQEYLDMLTGLKADVIKVLAKECKRSRLDGLVRLPHASPGDAWNVYPQCGRMPVQDCRPSRHHSWLLSAVVSPQEHRHEGIMPHIS